MTHTVKHASLHVTALDPDMHEQTCNYWYTVTSNWTAHTAFTTKAGLLRWLEERGLSLDGELPETRGEWANVAITGEYYTTSHGEFSPTEDDPYRMVAGNEFGAIEPLVTTWTLSNGDYTLALIDETDGVRTVHTLNPNVRDRITADHASMRALMK